MLSKNLKYCTRPSN